MRFWKDKPLLRSTDSYISATNTARHLAEARKILIVGDTGGRDWKYLASMGKEIHIIDIAPQQDIPNLIVQSIEKRTPFEDEFFDGAVLNEVLEHLFLDVSALEEVYRVLKKNGTLVVTVPYYSNVQDDPEYHVRVHTPKTIHRLLQRCGFEIEEHFCRGFCTRLPQLGTIPRAVIYMGHKLVEFVTRKSPDQAVHITNGALDRLERFLGSYSLTIRFQRLFASYGGVMKARKVSAKRNFDEVQVKHFAT